METTRTSPRSLLSALLAAFALAVMAWLVASGVTNVTHSMANTGWHKTGDTVANTGWHKQGDVLANTGWHSVQP